MAYLKNNEIQTRIALKYDLYENWVSLNPVLLAGEVAVATVAVETEAGFQNQPNVIFKVGDGFNHFNDLKTVSALAADVYGWAKEAQKPSYDAKEVSYTGGKYVGTSIESVISEIAADISALTGGESGTGSIASQIAEAINGLDVAVVTAGTGEVIGSVEQVDGKLVATKKTLAKEDIPAIGMAQVTGLNEALEALQGTPDVPATSADNSVAGAKVYADEKVEEAVESIVGSDADTAESNTIAGAKTYADEKVDEAVESVVGTEADTAESNTITGAKVYADEKVDEAVDSILGSASDSADSNTIAGAKIYADEKATTAYNNSVTYVTQQLVNYEQKGTAETKANEALDLAKDYADSLAKDYEKAGNAAQAESNAKSYADSLAANYDKVGEAAKAETAAKSYADSLAVNYDKAGAAASALAEAKSYANGLAGNYDPVGSAAAAQSAAEDYADSLAGNYDASGSAAQALIDAKAYANSLAGNYDGKGSAAQALIDAKKYADDLGVNYDDAGAADEALAAAKKYVTDNADSKGSAAQALTDAKTFAANNTTAAINALNVADEAIPGQVVIAVSENGGKITVSRGVVNAADVALNTDVHPTTNVASAIDGLSAAINDAAKGHIVTLTASDSEDYAKVYTLKQGDKQVGIINIPKDIVVKSGSVVDGKIVLVLNDENATEIVIPAGDLIEYVTSGSVAGDMIVVNVDANHKVTATITDGTVTLAKLASSVQGSLAKADAALQVADIATGGTAGTISVRGTDVAVNGLHAIAFDGNVANLTQTADSYIIFNCGSASVNI